jgi:hypothetical protein
MPGQMACVGINSDAFENQSFTSTECTSFNSTEGLLNLITLLQVYDGVNGTLVLDYDDENIPPECSQMDPGFSKPTQSPTQAPSFSSATNSSAINTFESIVGGLIAGLTVLIMLAL